MRAYRYGMTSDDYYGALPEYAEPELVAIPVFRRLEDIPPASRLPGMEARPDEVELMCWPDDKRTGRFTAWCESFARIHPLPVPYVAPITEDEYERSAIEGAEAASASRSRALDEDDAAADRLRLERRERLDE